MKRKQRGNPAIEIRGIDPLEYQIFQARAKQEYGGKTWVTVGDKRIGTTALVLNELIAKYNRGEIHITKYVVRRIRPETEYGVGLYG